MYKRLRGEMAYRGVQVSEIAKLIGRSISTTSNKMRGYSERDLDDFSLGEALKIYDMLNEIEPLNITMNELFKNVPEEAIKCE